MEAWGLLLDEHHAANMFLVKRMHVMRRAQGRTNGNTKQELQGAHGYAFRPIKEEMMMEGQEGWRGGRNSRGRS